MEGTTFIFSNFPYFLRNQMGLSILNKYYVGLQLVDLRTFILHPFVLETWLLLLIFLFIQVAMFSSDFFAVSSILQFFCGFIFKLFGFETGFWFNFFIMI